MSTHIGVLTEGPIDRVLIGPLLSSIASERAGYTWPVDANDALQWLQMRTRGHGGVWHGVQRMVRVLKNGALFPYAFVVILLDHRTAAIQEKVRKLIAGSDRFVLAVAQEEIEAWWLGDRTNTLAWLGFTRAPTGTTYADAKYLAEKDPRPKRTLHELTERSSRVDRLYGEGNLDLAWDFAELWRDRVRLAEVEAQCPQRFPSFCRRTAQEFRRAKRGAGRLLHQKVEPSS